MGRLSRGCATGAAFAAGILLAGQAAAFSPRAGASPATGPAALPVSPGTSGAVTAASQRPEPALAEAMQRLEASDAVWKRNDADFRRQRSAGTLSGAEADAFAAYVAELKVQLLRDCAEVRRLGGGHQLGRFACEPPDDRAASGPAAALPPDPETATTREEAAESLDDELRRIEGELDELTRRKAEAARRSASLPAGSGADGQGGGSGVNGRAGEREAGARGGTWTDPGGGESAPRRGPGGGRGAEEPEKETAKVDRGAVESGDDDDVVARQLREAAERETDPALKEKLWAEYRKYKAAQR